MKTLMFIQRSLATLIDLIIIYLPSLLLVHIIFRTNDLGSFQNLFASVLFALYSMIAESSFEGKTLGKYFAKLKVVTFSQDLAEIGQREVAKILYFLPYVGPIFLVISLICYIMKGKFLHDVIGRSEVTVFVR